MNSKIKIELTTIWKELLTTQQISDKDHFFELGGDSLLAMRLTSRIQNKFGIRISVNLIFQNPTLADLASAIEKQLDRKIVTEQMPDQVKYNTNSQCAYIQSPHDEVPPKKPQINQAKLPKVSLFFFSAQGNKEGTDKYKLFLDSVKFAEENAFHAVWIPERHFSNFGGLYPSPAVLGGVVAGMTKRLGIRAGSVVIPMRDPLRVAEEWSILDNISRGRVGIACASGWHVNDFVLAANTYHERKKTMLEYMEQIQLLWRGDTIKRKNGIGQEVEVRIFPRPLQQQLPLWLSSHADATFILAARLGINILMTHWDKNLQDIARQIQLYRSEFKKHHPHRQGTITLMLHTYVGKTQQQVIDVFSPAYASYLSSNMDLLQNQVKKLDSEITLHENEKSFIIHEATQRMINERGLIGTPDICRDKLHTFYNIGVDEVACLIDFGVEPQNVMASLQLLKQKIAHSL